MKKLFILMTLLFVMPVFGTVSDGETIREAFTCDGLVTTYTFTFACNSSDEVLVYSPLTATGQSTTALTVDVDYTISPTGGSYLNGGVVTITPALASTFTVEIVRRIKLSQETASGAITPTSIVAALDKITRQLQDSEDRKDRSLHLPESDDITLDMTIPPVVGRAGLYLGFDLNGEPVALAGPVDVTSASVFGNIFVQTANALSARGLLELDTDDPVEFAAGTFSGLITANGGVTLGAGDDLIGSATSDITINTDKFSVDGATGDTVIAGTLGVTGATEITGVATLGDGSLLKTSAAPTTDAMIANKKYVDDFTTMVPAVSGAGTGYAGEESVTFQNGIILKQGSVIVSTGETVTFGVAFPNDITSLTLALRINNDNRTASYHLETVSDFKVYHNNGGDTAVSFQAWGY